MVDIDHFKVVNDTHGHLVGDKALRAVAGALREQLRSYDLAGRFGGEEFAILLPQTREAQALRIAERLRTHIASLTIPVSEEAATVGEEAATGPVIRLTVSVGVASLDRIGPELTDLLAAADAALYLAKQAGRNQTRIATTGTPTPLAQAVPAARPAPSA